MECPVCQSKEICLHKALGIGAVVVVLVVGGYFLYRKSYPAPTPVSAPTTKTPVPLETESRSTKQPTEEPSAAKEEESIVEGKMVIYTDDGFSPATLTVKKGETVTFSNQSSRPMWPASDVHPIHSNYSGTSLSEHCGSDAESTAFDACQEISPNESWSFTFTKAGTWNYHDHLNAGNKGTIVVE